MIQGVARILGSSDIARANSGFLLIEPKGIVQGFEVAALGYAGRIRSSGAYSQPAVQDATLGHGPDIAPLHNRKDRKSELRASSVQCFNDIPTTIPADFLTAVPQLAIPHRDLHASHKRLRRY